MPRTIGFAPSDRVKPGQQSANNMPYDLRHVMYILESEMQVARWGNSLAVRLPASVVEALNLKPGDNIDIHVQGERAFAIEKAPDARELLARIRKYRGRLPADFKFDRLEANERG
jgi:antitoxin MazE